MTVQERARDAGVLAGNQAAASQCLDGALGQIVQVADRGGDHEQGATGCRDVAGRKRAGATSLAAVGRMAAHAGPQEPQSRG